MQGHQVIVCRGSEHPALYKKGAVCPSFSWVAGARPVWGGREGVEKGKEEGEGEGERKEEAPERAMAVLECERYRMRCQCRIRYRSELVDCVVRKSGGGGVQVEFVEAQKAVAPGQTIALYDGDVCLGGGAIGEVE